MRHVKNYVTNLSPDVHNFDVPNDLVTGESIQQ
jgi:hypothetical protein